MNAREFRWPYRAPGRAINPELVDAAWQEFRATRSESARQTLLQRYIHLVRYMVTRLGWTLSPSVDIDDLVSAGVVGFLGSLETFDPELGTDFSVYALTRIRGSIVDFMREIDPVGRVTRRRLRGVASKLAELEQELGREPSHAETAESAGLTVDDYHRLLARATAAMPLSLDGVDGSADDDTERAVRDRIADTSVKDPLASLVDKEAAEELAEVVVRLPQAQQLVLHLHYVEELNFREVAMAIDISESRANQLHGASLSSLRGRLQISTSRAA